MSGISYTIKTMADIPGAIKWALENITRGIAAGDVVLTLGREKRSTDQNARLWAILSDVAGQVDWYGEKLSSEDWKNVFTASLSKQKVVPGIDGGFVVFGGSTSKMDKKQFTDLMHLIDAFGAEKGVVWSDPAIKAMEQYRESEKPKEQEA